MSDALIVAAHPDRVAQADQLTAQLHRPADVELTTLVPRDRLLVLDVDAITALELDLFSEEAS